MEDMHKKIWKKESVASDIIYCVSLIVISFAAAFTGLTRGHNWGGDFSQYIAQAQAILDGSIQNFIMDNTFIINNSCEGLGSIAYPWGFPLILAGADFLGAHSIWAYKCVGVVVLVLLSSVLYIFFRKKFSALQAFLMSLFVGVNYLFVSFTNNIMSDLPYCLFAVLSLIMLDGMFLAPYKRQYVYSVLFALFALFATKIRMNGLVLILTLAAVHISLLLKKHRFLKFHRLLEKNRYAPLWPAHMAAYVIYIAGYLAFDLFFPAGGSSHFGMLHDIHIGRIFVHFWDNLRGFSSFLPFNRIVNIICALILGIPVAAGLVKKSREDGISLIYGFGTLCLYSIWQYNQGMRFLFSIFPVLLLYAGYGLLEVKERIPKLGMLYATFCIGLIGLMAVQTGMHGYENLKGQRVLETGAYSASACDLYDYIGSHTDREDVIIFIKPRVLYLNTGRLGFTAESVSELDDKLGQADYLLVCEEIGISGEELAGWEGNGQYVLTREYANETFELYKISGRE